MKIDNNLLMAQMAQRWDDVRSHFDHSSQTNLYLVDKEKPSGVVRITFTVSSPPLNCIFILVPVLSQQVELCRWKISMWT